MTTGGMGEDEFSELEFEPVQEGLANSETFDESVRSLAELTGQSKESIRDWLDREQQRRDAEIAAEPERQARRRQNADAALRDEEHCLLTLNAVRSVLATSPEVQQAIVSGLLTLEELSVMASMVATSQVTGRHGAAAVEVGEAVRRLIQSDPGYAE